MRTKRERRRREMTKQMMKPQRATQKTTKPKPKARGKEAFTTPRDFGWERECAIALRDECECLVDEVDVLGEGDVLSTHLGARIDAIGRFADLVGLADKAGLCADFNTEGQRQRAWEQLRDRLTEQLRDRSTPVG